MVGRVHWLFGHSYKDNISVTIRKVGPGYFSNMGVFSATASFMPHNRVSGKLLLLLCLLFGRFNLVYTGLIETGK